MRQPMDDSPYPPNPDEIPPEYNGREPWKDERPLTTRQRLFVIYYTGVSKGNGTDAAKRARYSDPGQQARELLRIPRIRAAVEQGIADAALESEEILTRLTEQATGSLEDFVKIDDLGNATLDLKKAKDAGKLHLIKRLKPTRNGMEIELHDAHAALVDLARVRGLFNDKLAIDLSGWSNEDVIALARGSAKRGSAARSPQRNGAAGPHV